MLKAKWLLPIVALALHPAFTPAQEIPPVREVGFESIFDGKSLYKAGTAIRSSGGWKTEHWSAKRQPTKQPKQNTFLIWRGGSPADFASCGWSFASLVSTAASNIEASGCLTSNGP